MENKVLKPKIRFKGFTDTWEQRKLKDESDYIVAGGDIEKNKIDENGKYPVIANALTNEGIVGYYKEDYRIKAPAVTVTGRGDVGHAVARNIDFTPVVRLLTIKSKHYNYFLENAINNLNVVVESTGVPQLTVPQLENYEIQFPKDLNEETQIGNLFKQIDNLITLHQSKYDKLVNVKKALLEKMFPKDGKNVPEIRFKGFTDTWEQRKLGEIANIIMGQSPDGINYTDNPTDNILIQGNADLDNGMVVPRIWTTQITKISKPNDIIFTVRAPVGEVAKNTYNAVIGRGVASISGNNFLYQALKKMKEFDYWSKLSAGSTFDSINSEQLKNSEINIPLNEEQKQIGNFLEKIDNLITLHQHKLEKLKNMKKSLLNKMFI